MTQEAFDQSVTDEINRRMAHAMRDDKEYRRCIGCGQMTEHSHRLSNGDLVALCASCILNGEAQKLSGEIEQEIAPYIAKIPLRTEYQALIAAADAYEAQSMRLLKLSRQAREQAQNLKQMANL